MNIKGSVLPFAKLIAEYSRGMTRRKLTTLIVAGVFGAALLGVTFLKSGEPATPQDPAATTLDARRPADATPAQIQEAPQSTQDVFVPPLTDATGSSPAPKSTRH